MSSIRSTSRTRTARSATSPPPAIRPHSAATSRSPWSRAARHGTARAPSSRTRCATASGRSRSSAIISTTRKGAACMVEPESPLGAAWKPGSHGKVLGGPSVVLEETRPGSIVQVAAFPGEERALIGAINAATGLALPDGAGGGIVANGKAAFGFAPGRFLVVDQDEGLGARLKPTVPASSGTVTDLSHGRTAIRVSGPKAEWVLAKFFAIDFSLPAFPQGAGRSTA